MSQYNMDPSRMRSLPASSNAFSSAWMQRQVDRPTPAPWAPLHLGPVKLASHKTARARRRIHPPSLQFRMFLGVPLYPVLTTRFSRTSTHPTRLFMQLLR